MLQLVCGDVASGGADFVFIFEGSLVRERCGSFHVLCMFHVRLPLLFAVHRRQSFYFHLICFMNIIISYRFIIILSLALLLHHHHDRNHHRCRYHRHLFDFFTKSPSMSFVFCG
jgi:hypothetical protein